MKRVLTLSAMFAAALMAGALPVHAGSTTTTQYELNNSWVAAVTTENGHDYLISMGVQQSRGQGGEQTILWYDLATIDNASYYPLEGGWGYIPSRAVTFGDTHYMSITIDTSQLTSPDFNRYMGNGGLLQVSFNGDSGPGTRSSGGATDRYDIGPNAWIRVVYAGTTVTNTATASGTLMGIPFSAVGGLASGVNATVQIVHD